MKRLFPIIAMLCVLAGAFTSCKKEVEYNAADLFGKWQTQSINENSQLPLYYVLYNESVDGDYFWGKEWDEGDGTIESDVDNDFHGNGWFKWKIEGEELIMMHMMNISEANAPKYYTITLLTETTFSYQNGNKTVTWTRVQ